MPPHEPAVVLPADGEPDIRQAIASCLRTHLRGVAVEIAEDAHKAPARQEHGGIELILSDNRMPGMDGLAFPDPALQRWPGVPRAMRTAHPDLPLALRAANDERVSYFLGKPGDPDRLRGVVGDLFWSRARDGARDRARDEVVGEALLLAHELQDAAAATGGRRL